MKKTNSKKPDDLTTTLYTRGTVHGKFTDNAAIAHDLKQVVRTTNPLYNRLTPVQKEAIDNILMKLSRIISGDPNHIDAWRDVAGYATLVMEELQTTNGATDTITKTITIKNYE